MALSISRYCKIISKTFRVASSSSSVRQVWAREASKSCSGTETPAAEPCPPRPRPPCRPPPPSAARSAVRVACCPAPRARRPPCPVEPRSDPLTCDNRRQGVRVSLPGVGCGACQDRVARRLAAAEVARRADYEHEARCEDRSPRAACAPLSLGGERHCARATDGEVYTLPCAPDPLPPCGPCREPPPPRPLPMQPDDACKVTAQRHVDPCAHRPRTFVEIARGKNEGSGPASAPAPDRSLASRILDGLTAGTGRKCTSPTQGGGCRRGLHTSAMVAAPVRAEAAPDASARGIDEVLRERATFKEAGRGRVASCEAGGAREPPPAAPGAQLELPVPPNAARVTVCVTLHEGPRAAPPPPTPALRPAPQKAPASCPSNAERRDSWLSFKSIQQKFSNKRDGDEGCGKSKPPCPARPPCPPPCPPPAAPPPPPAPKHPYPRHPCPPRPTCPPPKTTQPSKDKKGDCNITTKYLPLTIIV